jgi:hypothetical protein
MKTGPNWHLDDDRKTVTITFPTNPPVALKLDARAVDDVLNNLGAFRAAMTPEVPRDHSLGQRVAAVPNPLWQTEPEMMLGDSLLHLRDPRFGWLDYMIPREEARKLAGFLLRQADNPPPAPRPSAAN